MIKLMLGDCLQKLTELPDNSVDSIVTDPPYGLCFMGKSWDYDVPAQHIWEECLRVLKPGGHLLAFFGTRTYHRGVIKIEDAGFEVRDMCAWNYGQGFPKSHNLKDEWQGWGTALKPALEPIVVARKPLEKGLTVAENVLKWGTGALNIDGSRIEFSDNEPDKRIGTDAVAKGAKGSPFNGEVQATNIKMFKDGRWPANVLLDEVAATFLDEQSGERKSGGSIKSPPSSRFKNTHSQSGRQPNWTGYNDSGGASRFFYVAKASKSERNTGLEDMPLVESGIKNDSGRGFSESDPHKKILNQNFHPTVKPIKLMQYLINLVTPPKGIVLDPFMGSGSTGVAAKNLGFGFIGIEKMPEYFEIAQKRIGA
ncbi:MAG: DNA-methyltransferase [Pseudobdellovibrionaceae bacterium]